MKGRTDASEYLIQKIGRIRYLITDKVLPLYHFIDSTDR